MYNAVNTHVTPNTDEDTAVSSLRITAQIPSPKQATVSRGLAIGIVQSHDRWRLLYLSQYLELHGC